MASDTNKASLSSKDVITITLSLSAFILSVINFYFINYRVEDDLQARVTNTDVIRDSKDSTKPDTAIVQIAFVNSGNRQAIILPPWFQLSDSTNTDNGAWGGKIDNDKDFPIILQPHETKVAEIKLSANILTLNPGKVSKDNPSMFEYYLAVEYFSLDSKAKKHDVWGDFNVHVYAKGNDISAIMETENLNKLNSVDLFSDKNENKNIIGSKSKK